MTKNPSDSIAAVFPQQMAIVDCETTGTKPDKDRITEIAIILVDEGRITQRQSWLVNPGRSIPHPVQRLTGISDKSVASAPSFCDLADELYARLQGRTLVAHNARFDYGFLRNEFERLDIKYTTTLLCSLRLSRLLFSEHRRHRLSDIVTRYSLPVSVQHRAEDDAMAVWHFLQHCSSSSPESELELACTQLSKRGSVPANLPASEIDKLPNTPGVYRFYDDNEVLLYVGKSVALRTRVMSHFSGDHRNSKDARINARLHRIEFTCTPTDFGAQILESQQIKSLAPVYNRQLRRSKKIYQLVPSVDHAGYATSSIQMINLDAEVEAESLSAGLFRSQSQAKQQLLRLADEFSLCHQLLGLETRTAHGCFRAQLKRCAGACRGLEDPAEYNQRFEHALSSMILAPWPWSAAVLITEQCESSPDFVQHHLVDQWKYLGQISSQQDLLKMGWQPVSDQFVLEKQTAKNEKIGRPIKGGFDVDMYFILNRFLNDADKMTSGTLRCAELSATEAVAS